MRNRFMDLHGSGHLCTGRFLSVLFSRFGHDFPGSRVDVKGPWCASRHRVVHSAVVCRCGCAMFGRQDITQSLQSVAYVSMALERHADEEHVNKIEQIQCMGQSDCSGGNSQATCIILVPLACFGTHLCCPCSMFFFRDFVIKSAKC